MFGGQDAPKAMLEWASGILMKGRVFSLIAKDTKIALKNRGEDLEYDLIPEKAQVLIVFSFFLGSSSLV